MSENHTTMNPNLAAFLGAAAQPAPVPTPAPAPAMTAGTQALNAYANELVAERVEQLAQMPTPTPASPPALQALSDAGQATGDWLLAPVPPPPAERAQTPQVIEDVNVPYVSEYDTASEWASQMAGMVPTIPADVFQLCARTMVQLRVIDEPFNPDKAADYVAQWMRQNGTCAVLNVPLVAAEDMDSDGLNALTGVWDAKNGVWVSQVIGMLLDGFGLTRDTIVNLARRIVEVNDMAFAAPLPTVTPGPGPSAAMVAQAQALQAMAPSQPAVVTPQHQMPVYTPPPAAPRMVQHVPNVQAPGYQAPPFQATGRGVTPVQSGNVYQPPHPLAGLPVGTINLPQETQYAQPVAAPMDVSGRNVAQPVHAVNSAGPAVVGGGGWVWDANVGAMVHSLTGAVRR